MWKGFLAVLSICSVMLCAETAYMLPQGKFFFCSEYQHYKTDHFWNHKGSKKDSFSDFDMNSYRARLAYGLSCKDTISLKGAYIRIDEKLNGRTLGMDDLELSWKRHFGCWNGKLISAQLTTIIPMGDKKQPVRYGSWGAEAAILMSKPWSYHSFCGWIDSSLAYRWYEGFPSDQIRASFIFGTQLNRWTLVNSNFIDYGLWNGKKQIGHSMIRKSANYRLWKTQLELRYQICRWLCLSGGYFQHLWGRNVGTGGGYFGNFSFCF